MKVTSFHFMPYRELPEDVHEKRYPSIWVDAPWWEVGDAEKVGEEPTTSPSTSSCRPPSSSGPISINAVRYWLDTSPGSVTVPPRTSGPVTVTGR